MSNKVIIASAGSGKTTYLVETAYNLVDARILITTFTDENADEIQKRFFEKYKRLPNNVTILPWFTFLLQEGVRPYQGVLYSKRIAHVHLVSGKSTMYVPESDFRGYYLLDDETVYSDKLAQLACKINKASNELSIKRLEKVYTHIFVDEVQDLAGYDLDFLDLLFSSRIKTILVGDPRQATFASNDSPKNSKFRYSSIDNFFKAKLKEKIVEYDDFSLSLNHRCVQPICEFSNELFPEYERAMSSNKTEDSHIGIWFVRPEDVTAYLQCYNPMILRHDKRTTVPSSYPVLNFGKSKGRTFKRVLIYPTSRIIDWLQKGVPLKGISRSKFYVALTRAQLSVAIVYAPIRRNPRKIPLFSSNKD